MIALRGKHENKAKMMYGTYRQHIVMPCTEHTVLWSQTRPEKKHLAQFGLDLIKGEVRNNVQAGVLEPTLAKTKIIQVGSTLLRLIHSANMAYIFTVSDHAI